MSFYLRKWATPLTMATFLITAITGIVLFFHAGGQLAHVAHEWVGWAVSVVFMFHMALNWRAFTTYFKRPLAMSIMVIGVAVTIWTSWPQSTDTTMPSTRAMFGAMQNAPITTVAELAGQTPDELIAGLKAAGFEGAGPNETISKLSGGDRGLAFKALGLAFPAGG